MDTENTMRITQTMATIAELMGFSVTEQADVANETVLQAAKVNILATTSITAKIFVKIFIMIFPFLYLRFLFFY